MMCTSLLCGMAAPTECCSQSSVLSPEQSSDNSPVRLFDDREKTYVNGLIRRRIYGVAESHCLRMLNDQDITIADQTALTVQLVLIRTSIALAADQGRSDQAWRSVWRTGEEFKKQFPRHPGQILVSVQTGLAHLGRANRIARTIEAQMVAVDQIPSRTEAMLEQCRAAKRVFTDVEREIERLLPEQRTKSVKDGEITPQELLTLKSNVRYQIALCQLQIAAGYRDRDTVAWRSALNDVLKRLQEVQDSVIPSRLIWWQSKVSQLECLLKLGRTDQVVRLLSILLETDPPAAILPQLIEQQLLLAITTGDQKKLKDHLENHNVAETRQWPALELARIRAAVTLSKLATDPQQQRFWIRSAAQMKQAVQVRHGAWWGRQAGLTLIRATGDGNPNIALRSNTSPLSSSRNRPQTRLQPATEPARSAAVEILIQTALQAQRNGAPEDALKAYDRAIGQTRMATEIIKLQIRASQILEQQSRHMEAARRLISVAASHADDPLAAATNLRGVWNMARARAKDVAQVAQQDTGETGKPGRLTEALKQHLDSWPNSPTKNQAALWLMAEYVGQRNFTGALGAFDVIETGSDSFPEALSQLRALFFEVRRLANSASPDRGNVNPGSADLRAVVREVRARLRARYDQLSGSEPSGRWSDSNRIDRAAPLVSLAVEIGLESPEGVANSLVTLAAWVADFRQRFATGEDHLSVKSREEKTLLAWASLLMVLPDRTVGQSDTDAAIKLLSRSEPDEVLCRRLFRVVANREALIAGNEANRAASVTLTAQQRALQTFGLEVIRIANRLPLSAKQSDRWKFQWGSLLRKSGQPKEAVSLLEPLAQRFRGDLLIQMEFARSLSHIEARQKDALKVWRRLAKSLTPASENWYEARLEVARQLALGGERAPAKKLLRYTRSVYGWEDSSWSDQLDRLLRTLRTVNH